MTLRTNIDVVIAEVDTYADTKFPNLPSVRRKSSDVNDALKYFADKIRDIADMSADELNTMQASLNGAQGDISTLQSGLANKANTSSMTSLATSIQAQLDSISSALSGKANTTHTHAMSDVTGLSTALASKNPSITASAATVDAATNAATNAPTNLNVVTTLLGSLTGEVNATNSKQNDLALKYNDLATKFNSILAQMRAQGLKSA